MKNILIFFGGCSVERDVSVITGVLTTNSLDKTLFNPIPIYVDSDGKWYTSEKLFDLDEYQNLDVKNLQRVTLIAGDNNLYQFKKLKAKKVCAVSCAINCMHGERGENGSLAGLLAICNIPLASPGVLSSAFSMDKQASKIFLSGLNIPVLDCVAVQNVSELDKLKLPFSYPVIVKPNDGGSSIGVGKANTKQELKDATAHALKYSEKVIIEPLLVNFTEINCAGYRNQRNNIIISPCERPIGADEILSFSDKYVGGKREFPAKIKKEIAQKIQGYTKKIYQSLNFSGTVRIDFFIKEEEVFVNEINAVPGSLAYYLFCDTLKEFSALLTEMISIAERSYASSQTLIKSYSSKILTFNGSKGAKKLK